MEWFVVQAERSLDKSASDILSSCEDDECEAPHQEPLPPFDLGSKLLEWNCHMGSSSSPIDSKNKIWQCSNPKKYSSKTSNFVAPVQLTVLKAQINFITRINVDLLFVVVKYIILASCACSKWRLYKPIDSEAVLNLKSRNNKQLPTQQLCPSTYCGVNCMSHTAIYCQWRLKYSFIYSSKMKETYIKLKTVTVPHACQNEKCVIPSI